jgi:energy-coupling factor transporter ATP-binding protein EcfA2
MEAVAVLEGVSYRYPGASTWALAGVDLEVPRGLTVVTGPTGSGKSTLLRVLSGAAPRIYGGELRGRVEVRGRAVLVPQEFDSFILMPTVAEDLEHAAEAGGAGVTEARRIARLAAEALGIEHLMGRPVGSLSAGERQRVAVAAALALGADVLLLDEPLAHQDEEGARLVVEASSRLGFDSVVAAEHRVAPLLRHARMLVVMSGGRVEAAGGPSEVGGLAARLMDPLALVEERLPYCREACRGG